MNLDALEELATTQSRLVAAGELTRLGFTSTQVAQLRRRGVVVQEHRGIYSVPPVVESRHKLSARAACDLRPGEVVVTCSSGLILLGCPLPVPVQVHVGTVRPTYLRDSRRLRAHRLRDGRLQHEMVDGIPVAPAPHALIGAWRDLDTLDDRRAIVCATLVAETTTSADVEAADPSGWRCPAAAELLRTCALVDLGCHSPLEIHYYLGVELAFALPTPERQVWIKLPDGRKRRVDALYEEARLIVELDGSQHWLDAAISAGDKLTNAQLKALGYEILRFTWEEVTQKPAWVAAQVRAKLLELATAR